MTLPKREPGVVVVHKAWANLNGVKLFLLQYENNQLRELEGEDHSFAIFADILDMGDPQGVWIELYTAKHKTDPAVERKRMFIPWPHVITILIGENSPEIVEDAKKKYGYSVQS